MKGEEKEMMGDVSPATMMGNKRRAHQDQSLTKRARLTKKDLYKPPTIEELATLKEADTLYQSSLLRLQVEELCSEVGVKSKKKKALLPILCSLEQALKQCPPLTIKESSNPGASLPRDICVPLKWSKTQVKGELKLVRPAGVKVVGSYLLGTCINTDLTIDMAVQIPTECLQPKDYLNFKYHHKRALYCAHLARHLRKEESVKTVSYGMMHGNQLMPVVLIKLAAKNATVRLIPCLPKDNFKETRFAPSKNNVRRQWYRKACQEETFPPTPRYNSTILQDMSYESHLHYLFNASHDFPAFSEAVLLLKVWLHQRELDQGGDGFHGFLASMLVAHLLDVGKINRMMSAYQVFRNTMHFIASSDWTSHGLDLSRGSPSHDAPPLLEFHRHFPVVFLDPSGCLNLCSEMTVSSYEHLKHEASQSLGILEDRRIDAFQCLFMTPVPFSRKFDHFIRIDNLSEMRPGIKKFCLQDEVMDVAGDFTLVVRQRLLELLKRALGERVQLISSQLHHTSQWPLNAAPPKSVDQGPLSIGLLLNPSLASSILDKGPTANTPEAAEFSEFWGKKCELRRFQDGSICEAVVWPGSSVSEKRLVCCHIVKHVFELHAGISPDSVCYIGDQLDPILHQPIPDPSSGTDGPDKPVMGTGEEEHALISAAYTKLSQHLRGLKDLPLSIGSVQGTSQAFRHTEVHPPAPGFPAAIKLKQTQKINPVRTPSPDKQSPAWVPSLKVMCHLESSGKWPDDLEAIHHIKAAFHLKMAELLRKQCKLVTVATAKQVFVMLDGFVFEVSVAHRREITLLKEVVSKEGLSMLRDNPRSSALEVETEHQPHLTNLLNGVQQHHGVYGPTVRMAKRWVSAHLLSDHVTSESLDLMVAYLFLHPAPLTPPGCPQTGFLRFLSLLCTHDWESAPLIINFNNDLKAANYDEIRDHFTNNRSHLPTMFLATPADRQKSIWTQEKPTIQIFKRLVALAGESLKELKDQLSAKHLSECDFKKIFRPPLEPYDVIIHLRDKLVTRRHEAIDASQGAVTSRLLTLKTSQGAKQLPVINFDPVQCYLRELREAFGELALFFHDTHGGNLIAVLWKRPAFKPGPFKALQVQAKSPTSSSTSASSLMAPNVEAILQDFQTMGQGIVSSIEVRTENWNI
ncbi:nucleolar protein 6-like [Diadema setosum]|uniref:nucleolar protein 6-like n=1 Tax=Diadema setosum TaxID=31175 RepID=UPI003B3A41F9